MLDGHLLTSHPQDKRVLSADTTSDLPYVYVCGGQYHFTLQRKPL
jgi:hypothetical protein